MVINANCSEFGSHELVDRFDEVKVRQRRIRAGEPSPNGNVERGQLTILAEW